METQNAQMPGNEGNSKGRENEKARKKDPTKRRSKSTVTTPEIEFPAVSALDRDAAIELLRSRRPPPRSTRNVRNVLQQLVGAPQKSGIPCGQCECCKSLLSYVTVLRNFMDHVVSGMSEGTPMEIRPQCAMCSVHPVEHVVFPQKSKASLAKEVALSTQNVETVKLKETADLSQFTKLSLNDDPPPSSGKIHISSSKQRQNLESPLPQAFSQNREPRSQRDSNLVLQLGDSVSSLPIVTNDFSPESETSSLTSSTVGRNSLPPTLNGYSLLTSPTVTERASSVTFPTPTGPSAATSPVAAADSLQTIPVTPQHSPRPVPTASYESSVTSLVTRDPKSAFGNVAHHSAPTSPVALHHSSGPFMTVTHHPPPNVPFFEISHESSAKSHISHASLEEKDSDADSREPKAIPSDLRFESIPWTTYRSDYQNSEETKLDVAKNPDDNEDDEEKTEAFITLAWDNLSALSCLVLGNSLVLSETTKTLVVLVTDSVTLQMRTVLSTVFDYVQSVDKTSQGYTALSLLEEPEIGFTFTKMLLWGLEKFSKGVFLDPNTLVVQNCDELFEREELSAASDIGWPDCFNTDVFVFTPSLETFWRLANYAEKQSHYDGGDQALMNSYFNNWCRDISKKLPFIYNLRANVSYTYKPAFKRFGNQVKVVNFFGSYKPIDVKFHSRTGQMAADANVHPTFAQFVYYWLEIFVKRVAPLLPMDAQDFLIAREYTCARDLLQFFPSPLHGRETLPTPPSFRIYPSGSFEKSTGGSDSSLEEEESSQEELLEALKDSSEGLPGTQMGSYEDMKTWEQGQMDYLGQHKSDTILARLDYFIQGKQDKA